MLRAADGHDDVRVERGVAEVAHDHALEVRAEIVEDVLDEVVGHRPRCLDVLERERDGGGLWAADEDREDATVAVGLAEEQAGDVRGSLELDAHQLHLDCHTCTLPKPPGERVAQIRQEATRLHRSPGGTWRRSRR